MMYLKIPCGGGAKRLSARASRSKNEELLWVSSGSANNTTPDKVGDPVENALAEREPAANITKIIAYMYVTILGDAADPPSSRLENATQAGLEGGHNREMSNGLHN